MRGISRRGFLRTGVVTSGIVIGGATFSACGGNTAATTSPTPSPGPTTTPRAVTTPAEALAALQAGNARFVAGHPLQQGRDSVRRAALAESQAPYAVILGCADSRVIPEVLFDEGIGDLFLVRVAGNTGAGTPILLGSMEFAVAVLGAKLIVVLGHQNCGAVKAALAQVTKGSTVPGSMPSFVQPILPAAQAATSAPADQQTDTAIEENVRLQVQALPQASSILQNAIGEGTLKIVGGVYQLASGRVNFLE